MADINHARQPWHGLTALAIALGMWASIWFLTTPEGHYCVKELLQPYGYEGLLFFVLAQVLFFGLGFFVLALAISAARRLEPFRLGEVALVICLSLFLQWHNGPVNKQLAVLHSEPGFWSGFSMRLLFAALVVFAASWGVRRLERLGREARALRTNSSS